MKTKIQNQVIETLRNLRIEKNISQATVARHLGISPGQLGNIESYKQPHKYTLKQIYELCELLEVPVEYPFNSVLGPITTISQALKAIIDYQNENNEKNQK